MGARTRDAIVLTVALTLLAVALVSTADGQQKPPLAFPQSKTLAVSCADLAKKSAPIGVRNETGREETVALSLSQLTDADGKTHDPSSVCGGVKLTLSLKLAPAASAFAQLSTGPPPKSGKAAYSGTVAAYTGGGEVIRRSVSLTEGPVPADAEPRSDTVSATIYRGRPWGTNRIDVPVAVAPDKPLALESGTVVGGVAGGGDTADFTYEGTKKLSDETTNVKLAAGSLGPGSYEASADLMPDDDEKGAVTLKLTVKDWWVYAALALLAGILLGLIVQRVLNVSIPKSRLRGRVGATHGRYENARKDLVAAAGQKPWAKYEITDLGDRRDALRKKIDDEMSAFYLGIDQKVIDALDADIKALEEGVDQFAAVDAKMRALEQALDAYKKHPPSPLPERTGDAAAKDEPAFIHDTRRCLDGAPMPLDELKARLAQTDMATVSASDFYKITQVTSQHCAELRDLKEGADSAQESNLEAISRKLDALWWELWCARDMERFKEIDAAADLDLINDDIAAARAAMKRGPVRAAPPLLAEIRSGTGRTLTLIDAEQAELLPGDAEEIAADETELKRARWGGYAVGALALAVALVTGLSAIYIDKPFGTSWDYIAAVAWGLGTQAVLASLTAAIGGVAGLQAVARRFRS